MNSAFYLAFQVILMQLLTQHQIEQCGTACHELLQCAENDSTFLPSIITGDETSVYGCDPEIEQMFLQWKIPLSPRLKEVRQVLSRIKSMLIAFFDVEGLEHHEFLSQGHNMDHTVYRMILQCLSGAVWKQPHRWSFDTWFLHQDGAPCHGALSVREFLAKHSIPVVHHPPYSPYLAPYDVLILSRLRRTLKRK
jgi:histone-lysine N-methyltransferase SETMAR